jgi:hypothetical protein
MAGPALAAAAGATAEAEAPAEVAATAPPLPPAEAWPVAAVEAPQLVSTPVATASETAAAVGAIDAAIAAQQGALGIAVQQQRQQQQQQTLLEATPGITVIKDPASMERLVATLSAAPSWGFAFHMYEPAQATGTARLRKERASSSKASKAGAVADASEPPTAAAAPVKTAWRWDVLGVAFSTCDGCAFYVPLYVTDGRGSSKDIAVRRGSGNSSSKSKLLQQMWQGLQCIFSCQQHKACGSSGAKASERVAQAHQVQHVEGQQQQPQQQPQQGQGFVASIIGSCLRSRVPELTAAAARAATATAAAGTEGVVLTATAAPDLLQTAGATAAASAAAVAASQAAVASGTATAGAVPDSLPAPPAAPPAAAAAAGVSGPAEDTWLSPAPVAVTFGLKSALKLLCDPPAASGLPGLQLQGPVVDVRVAAWLLDPEASIVAESTAAKDNTCK